MKVSDDYLRRVSRGANGALAELAIELRVLRAKQALAETVIAAVEAHLDSLLPAAPVELHNALVAYREAVKP